MNSLPDQVSELITSIAEQMRNANLPAEFSVRMERLAGQVEQPCEVAVLGRVKTGKSTFINALLGADEELAKVGSTETTATINYFRYGTYDPNTPVRCYWRNGSYQDVSRDFLNKLQGNDIETLRASSGISHLEYRLPSKFLEKIVLVDTPGLGANIDEHQNRTAEYLQLYGQLRQRHDQETQEIGSSADAVIYLMDCVTRESDHDFLNEFKHLTQGQSRVFNSIGVLARIDQQPELMSRRHELAGKVARQLVRQLNTVIPVSGGLEFAIHRLSRENDAGLTRMAEAFSQIPTDLMESLLKSDQLYRLKSCKLTLEERESLLDDTIPWTVFTTIVRKLTLEGMDIQNTKRHLSEVAGFEPLKMILDQHFFQRATYLRCFRILNEARSIVNTIRFQQLPELSRLDHESSKQRERFTSFIQTSSGDVEVANELRAFISQRLGNGRRREAMEYALQHWDRQLDLLVCDLEEHNADFEILQLLNLNLDQFSSKECDELRPLFGLYGLENESRLRSRAMNRSEIANSQIQWRQIAFDSRCPIRRKVAERAVTRFGLILKDVFDTPH